MALSLSPLASLPQMLRSAPQPGQGSLAARLNWLRAGVLGANDGIVSVAAVAVGVAGATANPHPIFFAGLAALIGGALSMALGEYVSVSSQRDALRAGVARGEELDAEDASPWHAALASFLSFLVGGALPFLTIVLLPAAVRIPVTFAAVLIALGVTGWLGAKFGGSPALRATIRVVVGGAIALAATFAIGALFGTGIAS